MKTLTVTLLTVLVAGASGFLIKVPETQKPSRPALGGWLHIQKLLLPLFENVCEESTDPTIIRIAQEFSLDAITANYENPEIVANLKQLYSSNGQLSKGEIFTELNQNHEYELKLLYDTLYYAQNFDTFYKMAVWARQNVNCGLFVNAIYSVILKRRDTEMISVPAPYELLPNYFIRQDVIIKASSLLAGEDITATENILNEGNSYTLDANYTANVNADDESKLAYFQEDIGLNSYYFLKIIQFAPWVQDKIDVDSDFGEYLYHFMKNLVARYNMERYSNGLMFLERIDWKTVNINSYDPMLVFSNGEQFSPRYDAFDFTSPIYVNLQNIEDNILTVISPMVQKGYNKSQIINNLMTILMTNLDNYESMACKYFGGDLSIENRWRSVLAHHMTSLRDPLFWKITKKIVDIVDDVIKTLPRYTRNELYFPGVQIQNVEVKKVMTMFESFKLDVTNALKTNAENPMFQVNIIQSRLNHKPFSVKLNISSLVSQKGLVKLYLGPKILPGEFAMKKNLFMLLDTFEINLKLGSNVISRTSDAMENISRDFASLNDLRKLVEDAEFGLEVQPPKSVETLIGFPTRLILPKGTSEGLPMQLLVFIAPFTKVTPSGINLTPKTEINSAIISSGYPFDLDFDDKQFLTLPNMMVKDIIVTHKETSSANKGSDYGPKKLNEGDTSESYGPVREPFDYNLRKSQYGKTENYADKRGSYYKGEYVIPDTISKTENDKLEDKKKLNSNTTEIVRNIPENTDMKNNDEDIVSVIVKKSEVTRADDYNS